MSASVGSKAAAERRLEEASSDIEVIALDLAESEGRVTTARLVQASGLKRLTASRSLKHLAEQKKLVWHGASRNDPKQYYSRS